MSRNPYPNPTHDEARTRGMREGFPHLVGVRVRVRVGVGVGVEVRAGVRVRVQG